MKPGSLKELFSRQADPYVGSDIAIANRIGGILWLVMGGLTVAAAPLAPPTARFGWSGWLVVAAVVAGSIAGGRALLRGKQVPHETLFKLSFLGVGLVALLQWLAGSRHDSYHELYLPWALLTGSLNPPRRLAAFLLFLTAAAGAFLAYDGWDSRAAGGMASQILIWTAIAIVASIYATSVRAQRAGLQQEGEAARRLARVDPLTGLGNRRALEESLAAEVSRCERTGSTLSVLVIDVNGFKGINDRHGHLAGDGCLRQVADAVRSSLRDMDSAFRWGGDEFVILLPETDSVSARAAAKRLRETMAVTCREPTGESLSIGCGVAQLDDGMSANELLTMADLALVGAKPRRSMGVR
ncbi:MAG: GGDEF domain-containing protein [Thermoleophilaceae bacterium]